MKKLNITAILLLCCMLLCSCSVAVIKADGGNNNNGNIHTNHIPAVSYEAVPPPGDIPVIYAPVYITSEYIPLDEIIFPAVNEIIRDGMTDKEKLEAVYVYLMQFSYDDRTIYVPEDKEQYREQIYAQNLFENGYGLSYDYSAAFRFMAEAIGFEAKIIYGYSVDENVNYADHAWVTINLYGTEYIFDPATEVILRQNRQKYGRERFMKTSAEIGRFYSLSGGNE